MRNGTKKLFLIGICTILGIMMISNGKSLSGTRIQSGVSDTHLMEDITFQTRYKASSDFVTWQITNNKAIEIQLSITNNPSNKTIMVNHMYAVIYVESRSNYYDDIEQDYMDDLVDSSTQGGSFVSTDYQYKQTFSVKGMSVDFIEMINYGIIRDPTISVDSFDKSFGGRYTETDLINTFHVIGQTLYVVYDILVKLPTEQYFHKFSISDNIYIDLNGTVYLNQADLVETLTENTKDQLNGYEWIIVIPIMCIVPMVLIKTKYNKKSKL